MATLSYNEITRENKEYRCTVIVEKVFSLNGRTNEFATEDGLFTASYLIIGDTKHTGKKKDSDAEKIGKTILSLKEYPTKERIVLIGGKFAGSKKEKEISVNQLVKSEEFGGQPAGGKKENKGIKFERDLEARLVEILSGKKSTGAYAEQAKKIIDKCSEYVGSPAVKVIPMGGLNQKRPIDVVGTQLYIMPTNPEDHGQKLTDITLEHANGEKSFLSLKYSSTLTFMNAGVGTTLSQIEIKKKKITNPTGKAILELFDIDESLFCQVFNEYGKGKKFPTVTKKLNAAKIKKFLRTCIGANYWMVHGMEGNKVYFWHMSSEKNPEFATITGTAELQYGGSSGKGKRIDISFSNKYFDFKVNIRNKQSGLYPSHIMCDYTSKQATGKELL